MPLLKVEISVAHSAAHSPGCPSRAYPFAYASPDLSAAADRLWVFSLLMPIPPCLEKASRMALGSNCRGTNCGDVCFNPGSVVWSCLCVGPAGHPRSCRAATIETSVWLKTIWAEWATSGGGRFRNSRFRDGRNRPFDGQYNHPLRVIAFNMAEHWSQDASDDVAHELRRRCDLQMRDIPLFLQDLVDRYESRHRDVQLPLPMRLV